MECLPKGDINKLGLIDCELSRARLRGGTANEKEFKKDEIQAAVVF